ncbi:hypothetical protein [Pelobacter seleniigenes]|uniref:hypothetical protein n=1 Tax=Pelobacter seleniigenes TaxID=407188 RepID=UPI0004A77840|nr:hypothetical protein [Pelobacter seleniigenes]
MDHTQISQDIIKHFHLYWDNFTAPVILVHKDRTVIAVNKAAEPMGCIPGTRCSDRGPKEAHQNCLANFALKGNRTERSVEYVNMVGMVLDTYWIPLAGEPDLYIHFGIDITPYASDKMFPESMKGQ